MNGKILTSKIILGLYCVAVAAILSSAHTSETWSAPSLVNTERRKNDLPSLSM